MLHLTLRNGRKKCELFLSKRFAITDTGINCVFGSNSAGVCFAAPTTILQEIAQKIQKNQAFLEHFLNGFRSLRQGYPWEICCLCRPYRNKLVAFCTNATISKKNIMANFCECYQFSHHNPINQW